MTTEDRPQLDAGTKVYRALPETKSAQSAEAVATDIVAADIPETVVLRLLGGMGPGRVPKEGSVPEKGDLICWTLFEHAPRGGAELPDPEDTPWTHGGPPGGSPPADAPDPLTPEDYL
jgi:hypothetical protein